jgi:hypothetical protein
MECIQTELDFPVCKSGYRPYDPVTGDTMYGCPRHHPLRLERLIKARWQPRPGWAAFDQWEEKQQQQQQQQRRRDAADSSGGDDDDDDDDDEQAQLDATPDVAEAAAAEQTATAAVPEQQLCSTPPPIDRGTASTSPSSSRLA